MKYSSKVVMCVVFGLVIAYIVVLLCVATGDPNTERVIVNDTHMQVNVSGDKDGTRSETVMMVYTDKGTFVVEQEGILARPDLVGKIQKGDTLDISYTWFSCPLIGEYYIITDAK